MGLIYQAKVLGMRNGARRSGDDVWLSLSSLKLIGKSYAFMKTTIPENTRFQVLALGFRCGLGLILRNSGGLRKSVRRRYYVDKVELRKGLQHFDDDRVAYRVC